MTDARAWRRRSQRRPAPQYPPHEAEIPRPGRSLNGYLAGAADDGFVAFTSSASNFVTGDSGTDAAASARRQHAPRWTAQAQPR